MSEKEFGFNPDDPEYQYLKRQGYSHEEIYQGHNPAVSEKQRRFMGAELRRKRQGKRTKTGMSEAQLEDFAQKESP